MDIQEAVCSNPGDPCSRIKTAYLWAGGLKTALGGAGVDKAAPVSELVGPPSAKASHLSISLNVEKKLFSKQSS